MLFTKSILKPKDLEDGLRISVMSKHTENDGVTPDPRITPGSYDVHMPLLAPPLKLVGEYYQRGVDWSYFENKYKEYLNEPNISREVKILANRALDQDITLLCIEDSHILCHRRVLAEACVKYVPSLEVIHR